MLGIVDGLRSMSCNAAKSPNLGQHKPSRSEAELRSTGSSVAGPIGEATELAGIERIPCEFCQRSPYAGQQPHRPEWPTSDTSLQIASIGIELFWTLSC